MNTAINNSTTMKGTAFGTPEQRGKQQ